MKKILLIFSLLFGVSLLYVNSANASSANVGSWSEFVSAWNNSAVDKIVLTKNIDSTALGTNNRSGSIEIDGQGYTINFTAGSESQHTLSINNPASSQTSTLNIHDIKFIANTGSGVQGLIYTGEASQTNRWTIDMSNLSYSQNFTAGQRFATVGGAKVNLSGNIDIRTNYENFIGAQSIDIAPNTKYYGVSNNSSNNNGEASGSGAGPVSVWYMTSTAGDGHIKIGKNATVSLVNYHTSNPYSPIYYHFGEVTVDEGATFNLNGGTSGINWYLNDTQGHYIVKNNATLSVSSNTPKGSANVINFSNTNAGSGNQGISVEPNGSLFVIGNQNSGTPLINMTGNNTGQYIKIDQPKAFDINNQGTGDNSAINLTRGTFSINNSNITLWNNGINTITSAASYAFENVATFLNNSSGNQSSNADLLNAYKNRSTARISGMNQPIHIYLQPWASQELDNSTTETDSSTQNNIIWDTDKIFRARISMGKLPISGKPDPVTGDLTYHTVWAIKNQLTISGSDSLGNSISLPTNENGFITVSNNYFQKATSLGGKLISLYGKYGSFDQTITGNVLDKTPPLPVNLTSSLSMNAIIAGTGEPGATITAKISHNGGDSWFDVPNQTIVDSSGKFILGMIDGLKKGDLVQVFATDIADNTTPNTDTSIHDADISAATKYEVIGILGWGSQFSQIDFGTHALTSKSVSYAAKENTNDTMSVIDSRGGSSTWRITAKMVKDMTLNGGSSILRNVVSFKNDGNNNLLSSEDTIIQTHKTTSDDTVKINDKWDNKDNGIFLNIPQTVSPSKGTYTGEIEWNLEDVPGN